MSKSLVKKALQIVESGDEDQSMSTGKKGPELSTNKHGLKKEKKRIQREKAEEKQRGKIICEGVTNKRSTLEEYKRKQTSNKNLKRLKFLKKLHSIKVDKSTREKILTDLDKLNRKTSKKNEEKTAKSEDKPFFTEDDFQRYVRKALRP